MGFAEWQIVGSRGGKMSVICSLENHARSWRRTVRFFLLLGCAFTTNAYAHKVNVFANLEGDRVYVQGYFFDCKKFKNSYVTVYASGDKPVVEGRAGGGGGGGGP